MIDAPYPIVPTGLRRDKGRLPPYVEAALFLLCGMIIGGAFTVLLLDHTFRQRVTRPELLPGLLLERMEGRLRLTDEQSAKAAAIIAEHFATFNALQREVQPEVQRTVDALRDDLGKILDDEQRLVWESRFEEIRAKWRPGPLMPDTEDDARLKNAANPRAL